MINLVIKNDDKNDDKNDYNRDDKKSKAILRR